VPEGQGARATRLLLWPASKFETLDEGLESACVAASGSGSRGEKGVRAAPGLSVLLITVNGTRGHVSPSWRAKAESLAPGKT
jgi:hypothetical protein